MTDKEYAEGARKVLIYVWPASNVAKTAAVSGHNITKRSIAPTDVVTILDPK